MGLQIEREIWGVSSLERGREIETLEIGCLKRNKNINEDIRGYGITKRERERETEVSSLEREEKYLCQGLKERQKQRVYQGMGLERARV